MSVSAGCQIGMYMSDNTGTCEPCPKGTYQDKINSVICTTCPIETSTVGTGSESLNQCKGKFMSIYHECEGGIEKSVPRITDWHYEACRVMTNGDREGRIFLSHPHTNNVFFFSLILKHLFLYWKT